MGIVRKFRESLNLIVKHVLNPPVDRKLQEIIKHIGICVDKPESEVISFVKENIISYEDLLPFVSRLGRFPNSNEIRFINARQGPWLMDNIDKAANWNPKSWHNSEMK